MTPDRSAPALPIATEGQDPRYADVDVWPVASVLDALVESQMSAIAAVRAATPELERAINAALPRLLAGGRLFYVGAGTSGRIGMQDGVELLPTFGWAPERLVLLLAGGNDAIYQAAEGAEDREDVARTDILAHDPGPDDVVLGIAASGSTPYTCAAVATARAAGSLTIGIACNRDSRLMNVADMGIAVVTGPEVISGSTRLKAGTAQKATLNLISTTLMIRMGHAYRGQMVDMRVVNAKLRQRACRMVRNLSGSTEQQALSALEATRFNVKRAVMICSGIPADRIEPLLAAHDGNLRSILGQVNTPD
ncbi:N-acetylmuramic acid 6-phosphate etherase [Komagataeibacter sucrofermentans]|uniref:N-acetylmuramic acid 6-phosphate etherase n=1 Tax=Komagataeibacter sucrofermentans TaxID=1053551 RepID=A0A318QPL2_9PROT|nr:N-acetylmuramic acid 6-phosphate etherase [Komagataeibacter sucrofermentans]PYD80370.1 N-acetylmuramic acid 6-phosphate etherase [Komagataeibacter sucrofermentans]GBQ47265.1 N-acetylmuramic acid 6-phosphate etherase [Komagataeibacter sucrofermentans DSM 15973]